MNREHHKWYSWRLNRWMELLVFGHAGTPMLVFPTSMGRFFEYENNGMIQAVSHRFESGALQAFCVDSVDSESWYNKSAHPRDRVLRHIQYENYIVEEVLPFIRGRNWSPRRIATGCSFGGYHAVNLALRHPDLITQCVSMGGAFDIRQFLDGYYDGNCYFHNPPDFLPSLERNWNGNHFSLVTGEWDICLGENFRMASLMGSRGVPHNLDVWGDRAKHDWPWWRVMSQKYFGL